MKLYEKEQEKIDCRKKINNYIICDADEFEQCKFYKPSNCEIGQCEHSYQTMDSCLDKCILKVTKKCYGCGKETANLKRGWDNDWYCSYRCEQAQLIKLFSSMPGAGVCKYLPDHIIRQLDNRWEDE